jgi:formiminotetrahydrofolate cyclodeaminase
MGAFMNVKINAGDLEDKDFVNQTLANGEKLQQEVMDFETEITHLVNEKI